MKDSVNVDVAVIGAGTAGLAAYRAAIANGKSAVVIEGGSYGTTCARVGCMPSKLLLAAAEAAHHAAHSDPYGVHADVTINGKNVMERVRRERDRFVGFVVDGIEAIPAKDKIRGYARFVSHDVLEVGEERVHAKSVVIATGSSPFVPPFFDDVRDRLVINDDVFSWETLPKSVAVFGTGVIGIELGQALARLGVRVEIFGRNFAVGPLTDPFVKKIALEIFEREVAISNDDRVRAIRRTEHGVEVTVEDAKGKHTTEFDIALAATGRKPNLTKLGLENAGVLLNEKGIPTFDRETLQCGDAPIFIAGDVNEDVPLLHEAADEGRIAGENAARFPGVKPGLRRSPLAIAFSDPQLVSVGDPFTELDPSRIVIGQVRFEDQGRSRVMLQNHGILRVYGDRASGRFLGGEMAGPRAEHIGHLLAWAHQKKMTIPEMITMPFYHPVVEEGLRTALRDADGHLQK